MPSTWRCTRGTSWSATIGFGAWPAGGAGLPWGLIWYAPATPYDAGPVHPEYHWAGLQLLAGNLYLLAGLLLLAAGISWVADARTTDRSAENKSGIAADGWVTREAGRCCRGAGRRT